MPVKDQEVEWTPKAGSGDPSVAVAGKLGLDVIDQRHQANVADLGGLRCRTLVVGAAR